MDFSRRDFIKTAGFAGGAFLSGCGQAGGPPVGGEGNWRPAYAELAEEGKLEERVEQAYARFENCNLCPRRCGVNRREGEKGFCNAAAQLKVHSHNPHFGEELPLVGQRGSGTVFFSNCNLRCVFCQNYPIAHQGRGRHVEDSDLAEMMLDLQGRGCHNINVVTPTHVMPNILAAVKIAHEKGLKLPVCYNTGGYETVENIKLLDGVVDIYLPDLKFMDKSAAERYAVRAATDYSERAQAAIKEMHRQVGDLQTDSRNIAKRGVMVRHLVMPNRVAGTREFVHWVAENLSTQTYVNIMSQYRVEHRAFEYDKISRAITSEEFVEAIQWAREAGLENLDARSQQQFEVHRRRSGS